MDLPCKGCIVFAICKTKKKLSCPLLFKYFIKGGIEIEYDNSCCYYGSPQKERLQEIVNFFDKQIYNSAITSDEIDYIKNSKFQDEMVIHWR